MADPIEYLLQNVVNPKFDVIMAMVMILGVILVILWIITNFINDKKLQTVLDDIEEKIKTFIEKKRTKPV
jgi:hypothetical protein